MRFGTRVSIFESGLNRITYHRVHGYVYVAESLPTIYCSVVTGSYLAFVPQFGRHEITASKFGLQKNAIDCRRGVIPSVSLTFFAGGATTRWSVDLRTSLLQRASRSPALITIEPGYAHSSACGIRLSRKIRTIGGAGWYSLVCGFCTSSPPT